MLGGKITPGIHKTDEQGAWSTLPYQVEDLFDYVTGCSFAQEPELLRQMSFEQKNVAINILQYIRRNVLTLPGFCRPVRSQLAYCN